MTDSRDCIITLLLNAVIVPTTRTSKENEDQAPNKRKKVTIREAKDCLIIHIKSINLFKPTLEDIKERFYKKKLTVQPLLIVVGNDLSTLNEFYVYIDNIIYKFPTFISSLDTCFKAFHVFDVEYPEYCRGVWIFIQRYFFNFTNENDKPFSQILGLISYLHNIKK